MRDWVIVAITGIVCTTALGITYFAFVRQDSSVLLALSSAIGTIVGLFVGRRR